MKIASVLRWLFRFVQFPFDWIFSFWINSFAVCGLKMFCFASLLCLALNSIIIVCFDVTVFGRTWKLHWKNVESVFCGCIFKMLNSTLVCEIVRISSWTPCAVKAMKQSRVCFCFQYNSTHTHRKEFSLNQPAETNEQKKNKTKKGSFIDIDAWKIKRNKRNTKLSSQPNVLAQRKLFALCFMAECEQ